MSNVITKSFEYLKNKHKNLFNILAILMFLCFVIIELFIYNKKINIKNQFTNSENLNTIEDNNNYYYDVLSLPRNSMGLLNDNNTNYINSSSNLYYKQKIIELIEATNNNQIKIFEGAYRNEIEQTIKQNNILFIGDSNAKHFEYYDILDKDLFIEMIGKNVNEEAKIIDEKLNEDKYKNVDKIIIFNGYNLDTYKTKEDYINAYKLLIANIKKHLPGCKIFIVSLLPATKEIILNDLESPMPHNIFKGKEFDIALENFDFENDTKYIDTKWIIKDNYHKEDGVHMIKDFYNVFIPYVTYFVSLYDEE